MVEAGVMVSARQKLNEWVREAMDRDGICRTCGDVGAPGRQHMCRNPNEHVLTGLFGWPPPLTAEQRQQVMSGVQSHELTALRAEVAELKAKLAQADEAKLEIASLRLRLGSVHLEHLRAHQLACERGRELASLRAQHAPPAAERPMDRAVRAEWLGGVRR